MSFIILCTVLLLIWWERLSRRPELRRLHVVMDADMVLVEPDEIITLRYTVYNTTPWPVLFVGFSLRFEDGIRLREEETWARAHATEDFTGLQVSHHFYLLPRRKFSGKMRFSLKSRGVHELGRYYVETGDLLGLHPVITSGDIGIRIICTAKSSTEPEVETLGGLMGDVSVRRFIHEDPGMILGYREYTGREPLRDISWTQTAKAGRLMVKQHDYTVEHNVTVVVNMEAASPVVMEKCLSLTRTVCERLEADRIPYAMFTNGDLHSLEEGLGRSHLFFILRRIGLSRPTGYTGFPDLVDTCLLHRRLFSSYIVITPALSTAGESALERLERCCERLCVLYGGGDKT